MQNQYHSYVEWEAEAFRRGCVVKPSGDGDRLAATKFDGPSSTAFGEWDPSGFGWFWTANSIFAGIDPRTIEIGQWPKL